MYAERGQNLDEAIKLINTALELEPENGYFIDSLGWAYYQQGNYPEALKELKRAVVKTKEPDPVIYEHLGDALVKNGQDDAAIAAWEKALQLDPTSDAVKKKVDDLKDRQRRVKGGPKASQ
jgi:tetratricopeptide (TPR) repeat protein